MITISFNIDYNGGYFMAYQTYQIISDGSCDLPPDLAIARKIKVVPFYVSFDGTTYQKETEEIVVRDFYQRMVDNPKVYPKSSLPNAQDYIDAFLPYVKQGIPILCICITTKFSGSFQSAITAADMLRDDYPDCLIHVTDATVNTVLQGQLVLEAANKRDSGASFEQCVECVETIKKTGRIFFTIGSMDYLSHGGRMGKLAGLAADTLGIKPLILLKEGEIFPTGITRSRKKGKIKLIEQVKDHFGDRKENPADYSIAVGYGYDYDEAVEFRVQLLSSLSTYSDVKDVPIFQIGATIGVHTGPHPIGIGVIRKSVID